MKKIIMMFAALAMTMGANAQGNNIGMGGGDGDIQSIHERITKLMCSWAFLFISAQSFVPRTLGK